MSTHSHTVMPGRRRGVAPTPTRPVAGAPPADRTAEATTVAAARWTAVLRFATGFIFLWAFLDKTFGLHYATTSAKAWINGGSPTKGFLGSVDVGPFESTAHAMAGTWWADWLFMLAMLGIGVAVLAGVALRPAAVAGTLVLLMMWLAEFPPAQTTSAGTPSGSPNPIVDYHIIYALALIVVAVTAAGRTWGLGDRWRALPYIRDHRWTW